MNHDAPMTPAAMQAHIAELEQQLKLSDEGVSQLAQRCLELEQQLLEHAEQGDAQAQYEVGRRFWNGDGVDQDHKQAADWFDRAARQGLAAAQCALGLCYERGDGVEQDMWQAAAWYQWAAQQDDVEAQLRLSECYEKGRGVPKDNEKAAEWLYKAAQHGGSYVKKWLKTLKK